MSRSVPPLLRQLCSRDKLRDLLDSNMLDYVDSRNLEQVGGAGPEPAEGDQH